MNDKNTEAALTVGAPAPAIELEDSDGEVWRSADRLGQSVVVIFHRHIH